MAMTATRTLSITVTEILYLKLIDMARKQNYTPTVYARLLLEAAYSARVVTSSDKALDAAVAAIGRVQPACTEGEAMIATATKQSEREIMALKDELAQANQEIERLRKLAKDGENFREQMEQSSVLLARMNKAEARNRELVQELNVCRFERDEARGRAEALLVKLPTPLVKTAPAQPIAEEPSAEAKPDIDVSYHLSVADRRKVRAWQAYGMSLAEVAKSLNLPQAWLAEAIRRT